MNDAARPSPDALLKAAAQEGRGTLKVFLGAAPGVGKTYEMLDDAAHRLRDGVDVVIGIVETHGRADTEAMTRPFEVVPRKAIEHQGRTLSEMDLDALLARRPQLALVDELAHTNAPGARHPKRYQDVEELLAAGIDVYTTLNVQHLESVNDVVASFTKVRVRETLPDRVIEDAVIEVVDLPPDELIERLKAGKVYVPEEASRALTNYFSKSNLSALRELALRRAAQAIDTQMLDYLRAHALAGQYAAGERLVVAVSEFPGSDGLVRAGKRIADALRASWTVVTIETERSRGLSAGERSRLAATLRLASELGATVASLPARSVVEGLKAFVADARTTQLVVGKSVRSRWFELLHGSVVDQIVRETPGVAVHVLPMADAPPAAAARAAPARGFALGPWQHYGWTVVMVAAVTALGVALRAYGSLTNVALLYLLPVMAAASSFGLRAGIAAGVLSSLAYNFFYLPPLYTFTIEDPENIVTALVLLGVAIATSQLAARMRAQAELAQDSARQNAALAGFARTLTGAASAEALAQTATAEVSRILDVRAILLEPDIDGPRILAAFPPENLLGPVELAAARWVLDRGMPAGRGSDTLTAADWLFLPLSSARGTLAVLGLARDDGRDPVAPEKQALLASLVDQASLAFDRLALQGEMTEVVALRERDRLRTALLSSVGHDLRTPLTAILGSVAELKRELRPDANPATIAALEASVRWLQRFLGNLLDMARVEAGALRLNIEAVDLTDAAASAVHDARATLANHKVTLAVPPDLPLVLADAQLLHHVILNLLDNAGRYCPAATGITIAATRTPDGIDLSVLDEGPGLPPGSEASIFETFDRGEGSDRKGGTGLGLAIVKGFAGAMGVSVSAANRETDGAAFALHFPEPLVVRPRAAA